MSESKELRFWNYRRAARRHRAKLLGMGSLFGVAFLGALVMFINSQYSSEANTLSSTTSRVVAYKAVLGESQTAQPIELSVGRVDIVSEDKRLPAGTKGVRAPLFVRNKFDHELSMPIYGQVILTTNTGSVYNVDPSFTGGSSLGGVIKPGDPKAYIVVFVIPESEQPQSLSFQADAQLPAITIPLNKSN